MNYYKRTCCKMCHVSGLIIKDPNIQARYLIRNAVQTWQRNK